MGVAVRVGDDGSGYVHPADDKVAVERALALARGSLAPRQAMMVAPCRVASRLDGRTVARAVGDERERMGVVAGVEEAHAIAS
jgi:hypothetical protein